jgi:Fic family protein
MANQPPYKITPQIIHCIEQVGEALGRLSVVENAQDLRLRRINRIQTIHGSLAIEGNTLTEEQISTILDGKPVIAPPREIQEVRNAIKTYDQFEHWNPAKQTDLLKAHETLMLGLLDAPGHYRREGVGIGGVGGVVHVAPPHNRVPELMGNLFDWLDSTHEHALIKSCVFHYEFEFIHPFSDGNGRMGRLWQSLILSQWNPLFSNLPVENMVYARQQDYYGALAQSTQACESTPFIEFMLQVILEQTQACTTDTPTVAPTVTPTVKKLISACSGEMSRDALQKKMGLKDKMSFIKIYLKPAMEQGLIEMTLPEKPNSRNQKYRLTSKGIALKKG